MVPAETNFQMATQLNRICVPVVRRKFPASSSVEKVSDSRKLPSLIRPSSDASIQADWRVDKNKAKAMLRSHFFLDHDSHSYYKCSTETIISLPSIQGAKGWKIKF